MSVQTRGDKIAEMRERYAKQRMSLGSDLQGEDIRFLFDELAAADAREQQIRDLLKLVKAYLWHGRSGGPTSDFDKAEKHVDEALAIIGDKP